jgi:hypothetical protein
MYQGLEDTQLVNDMEGSMDDSIFNGKGGSQ